MLKLIVTAQNFLHRLPVRRDDLGVTSVEYALLVTLIALVVIAGAGALGIAINNSLNNAAQTVTTPNG